ncbi:hypothetical protein COCNU_02G017310 [Cocos nucifera]|uniref:Uncharacterized protein n=1 Tax=Cocos nucifera TaxID=13894 RepID=A0A8K0I0M7_COCNU|nr:hypothetical protein COCNU_02G017310 [Cocos nucifera]
MVADEGGEEMESNGVAAIGTYRRTIEPTLARMAFLKSSTMKTRNFIGPKASAFDSTHQSVTLTWAFAEGKRTHHRTKRKDAKRVVWRWTVALASW